MTVTCKYLTLAKLVVTKFVHLANNFKIWPPTGSDEENSKKHRTRNVSLISLVRPVRLGKVRISLV